MWDLGTDHDAALAVYARTEADACRSEGLDIVLLSADSPATIMRTHSSYFDTGASFEALLSEGVLDRTTR